MQQLQDQLSGYSSKLLTDPSAGLDPIKQAAADNINRRYASIPDTVGRSLASRGYGSSGSFGNTLYQTAYQRSGELSNLDQAIAQMILQQKNTGASLADQLLAMTRSTTTTTKGPGQPAADAFSGAGNGLNNIATLLTLSKYLKNAGRGPTQGPAPPDPSYYPDLGNIGGDSGGGWDSGGDTGGWDSGGDF